MALASHSDHAALGTTHLSLSRLVSLILWLAIFSGSFVLFEPTPYEGFFALLTIVLLIRGFRLPVITALPIVCLAIWVTSGFLSVAINGRGMDGAVYIAVSAFLALTTIVIASLVAENPERHIRTIRRAYILTAVCSALLGIAGYFHIVPGSEMLVFFTRAKAFFKDPNVFSPFLILPALLLFQDVLRSSNMKLLRACFLLCILLCAILLSFSRASWGHLIFSTLIMTSLMFAGSRLNLLRLRIIGFGVFGICAGGAVIAALLAIPEVSDVFLQRLSFKQEYDTGETGRFGMQLRSLPVLLESPFGFGPHGFAERYGQDPHNVYLNGFSSYGWMGGFAYIGFVVATCATGLRYVLVATPWHGFFMAVFATYFVVSLEGFVIDTDHWRHYFLLAGLVWGLSAATIKYRRQNPRQATTES